MIPAQRILVVDDDQTMRDLLHALLPLDGFEVSSADGGETALQTVGGAETAFDLVLLDLHMPGLEGRGLIDALRPAVPAGTLLIGMSGSTPQPAVREALDAFLLKPFDTGSLQQAVRDARRFAQAPGGKNVSTQVPAPAANDASAPSAAGQAVATEPLDRAVFVSLARLMPSDELGHLYELTLTDVAKRLERIQRSAGDGDLAAAQREAHAIKGACGMVGAAEIQALAAAIEGGTSLNTSAIAQIPSACLRLRRMLDAKLQPVSLLGEPRS